MAFGRRPTEQREGSGICLIGRWKNVERVLAITIVVVMSIVEWEVRWVCMKKKNEDLIMVHRALDRQLIWIWVRRGLMAG